MKGEKNKNGKGSRHKLKKLTGGAMKGEKKKKKEKKTER